MKSPLKSNLITGMSVFFLLLFIFCTSWTENRNQNVRQKPGHILLAENELIAIAIAPDPTEREIYAARELENYLFRITNRHIPLIKISGKTVPDGVIAVGCLAMLSGLISGAELDAVASDGYVVRIGRKNGAVCGRRDLGTLYGTYELLKNLGVKFYSRDCEIVPKVMNLKIGEYARSARPAFDMRWIVKLNVFYRGLKPDPKLGYTPDDDMGYPGELGALETSTRVHSAYFLVPYKKYGTTHPEYFALQKDGQRYKPGMGPPGHLCISNEDVCKVSSENLLFLISKQPERTFFVVAQGDGRSQSWCQCNSCKALDFIPGDHMTDRLLEYVNYNARVVAKRYTEKKLLTLAYTEATVRPPEKLLPDPNVMVMYCPYPPQTPCQSHGLDCPKNQAGLQELKGWLAKCPENMYIFDYPCNYAAWYEPFGSFYAMVSKMKFYSSVGIRGIMYCVVPSNFRDLFIFVQGRLLWDPKADVEALVDEFMNAYYGPAAPAIREYFNFMHHEIDSRQVHQNCERYNPELVTAGFADKAIGLFSKAQAAVADDSVRLKRVGADKFCVLWSDINQRNTVNGKLATTLDEHAQRLKELVSLARDLEILVVMRYDRDKGTFKNWIRSVAPLSLQSEPWYYDPAVDIFLNQPENIFKY